MPASSSSDPNAAICSACGSAKCLTARAAWQRFDDADGRPEPPGWTRHDPSPAAIVKRCAAPKAPSPGPLWSLLAFLLGLGLAYGVVLLTGSTWLAGAAFVGLHVGSYFLWHDQVAGSRIQRHAEARALWERSWLCLHCGQLFQWPPEAPGPEGVSP